MNALFLSAIRKNADCTKAGRCTPTKGEPNAVDSISPSPGVHPTL